MLRNHGRQGPLCAREAPALPREGPGPAGEALGGAGVLARPSGKLPTRVHPGPQALGLGARPSGSLRGRREAPRRLALPLQQQALSPRRAARRAQTLAAITVRTGRGQVPSATQRCPLSATDPGVEGSDWQGLLPIPPLHDAQTPSLSSVTSPGRGSQPSTEAAGHPPLRAPRASAGKGRRVPDVRSRGLPVDTWSFVSGGL